MFRAIAAAAFVLAAALILAVLRPDARVVQLAPGVLELHTEMVLESGAQLIGHPVRCSALPAISTDAP